MKRMNCGGITLAYDSFGEEAAEATLLVSQPSRCHRHARSQSRALFGGRAQERASPDNAARR